MDCPTQCISSMCIPNSKYFLFCTFLNFYCYFIYKHYLNTKKKLFQIFSFSSNHLLNININVTFTTLKQKVILKYYIKRASQLHLKDETLTLRDRASLSLSIPVLLWATSGFTTHSSATSIRYHLLYIFIYLDSIFFI